MKKWLLTCSIDAINIDYDTIIESENEPSFWECDKIAQDNNCEWWMIELLEEGD